MRMGPFVKKMEHYSKKFLRPITVKHYSVAFASGSNFLLRQRAHSRPTFFCSEKEMLLGKRKYRHSLSIQSIGKCYNFVLNKYSTVLHLKRKHWHSLIQSSANNKYFWQFWLLFFTYLSPPYQKFPVIYPIHKEHICIDGVMQLLAVYLSLPVEPLLYCSRGASIIHCTLARCIVFIILYKCKIFLCKGIS